MPTNGFIFEPLRLDAMKPSITMARRKNGRYLCGRCEPLAIFYCYSEIAVSAFVFY